MESELHNPFDGLRIDVNDRRSIGNERRMSLRQITPAYIWDFD